LEGPFMPVLNTKVPGGAGCPFSSDAEYLEMEMAWLRARTSRIMAERRVVETLAEEEDGDPAHLKRPGRPGSREARCQVVELGEKETKLREGIDVRLKAHRASGSPPLGLDVICEEHDLSAEERLVLISATPIGLSQRIAETTLGDLLHYWGSLTVAECVVILGVKGLADWIRLRALFRPTGRLKRLGLIDVVLIPGPVGPDTLMCADVRLTLPAFGRIVGDPEVVGEGEEP
jgi:hypothetical protein